MRESASAAVAARRSEGITGMAPVSEEGASQSGNEALRVMLS
jgi:hypothetical protein